ncbi:MAG: VIT1/CCC1 transporter family protein [Actinobacteria bacterium]|nr:VIT1/CCC1 transporter family protein [Actinomycetota bacterium]MCL6105659.1 VIT1/CCC1 transporter family protein [Actinomycetota bacterium]
MHSGTDKYNNEHRNIQSGGARAAVFGISDGLVSNISLVLGIAGAHPLAGIVRLAGLLGLLGGAFSMGVGEYISMKAQSELFQRELEVERDHLLNRPEWEFEELIHIYESRGIDVNLAEELAAAMMKDPKLALETHAREELGINPHNLGSPIQASLMSFVSFCVGAAIPLLPWFFTKGTVAIFISLTVGLLSAAIVGVALSIFTGRWWLTSALRQLAWSALAAVVTFTIGRLLGATILS